ncbi:D-hexose-6-phosphate mutarotase [Shewanella sp. Isolate11]|uniref:D-hexose-6-phosphate mutarotase n=1 Tax=Shewanella sp. Isolate11 TaxID=2908530 RepID=UPI001EFEEC30|nr:D-hexose-6-phosphate mutarotase [Shewanella sp. Isolate11]MCG9696815.1 D-hexose-6-phosphate mutarotase [Shewanella sp. Isolate11]
MASVTTKKHPNGLEYVDVDTDLCQARIFLQGAQIDTFIPKGKAPLLWVSSADDYQPGNGIRGGIPICWPWFGMHTNSDWPQHGFARTRIWSLDSVQMKDQAVELVFSLPLSEADKQYWPYNTKVEMVFTLTDTLRATLINTNLSEETLSLTQALHTYFPIGDIHQLQASGFEGAKYIEFGEGPYPQQGDKVKFDKETDRVYTQLEPQQQLHTPQGTINVARENSHSAVLWNPWIDKSKWLSRFNDDDYLTMVCLEAANVLEDQVILEPNGQHRLTTIIGWAE